MEEENKTIWENANEILADYIMNPEDGSWVKKNDRNKEPIVKAFNMDDQSEQDTSFGLKEQDKEFIDKELHESFEDSIESLMNASSPTAFQDQGKVELAEDEKRIYEGYYHYIKDLYLNDFIIGSIVTNLYGFGIRYNPEADIWLVSRGNYWEISDEFMPSYIYSAIEKYRRCLLHGIDENDTRDEQMSSKRFLVANINRFASYSKIESIMKLMKTFEPLRIDNDEINRDKNIIVCDGNRIKLDVQEKDEKVAEDENTRIQPIIHVNHTETMQLINGIPVLSAENESFKNFLNKLFDQNQEIIEYVQKVMGYCLTGETKEGKIFIAFGSGNNGKSTFIDCIKNVMGDYAAELPFKYITAKQINLSSLPELEQARTKRLLVFKSSSKDKALNKDTLKLLANGSEINIKCSRSKSYRYRPDFKIWMNLDSLPNVDDVEDVFWERLCIIPFNHKFGFKELRDIYDNVIRYKREIMDWLIEGAYKYYNEGGLIEPKAVKDATENYLKSQDSVTAFLHSVSLIDNKYMIKAKELYQAYVEFCFASGLEALNITRFGKGIKAKGIKHVRTSEGIAYCGIRLECDDQIPEKLEILEKEEQTD